MYRRDSEHFGARDERFLTEEAERPLPYTADALAEAQADDMLRHEEGDGMLYSTDSEEDCVQLSSMAASNGEADLVARLGEEVADLVENDQTIVLAQGGDGGRGNAFIPRRRARQARYKGLLFVPSWSPSVATHIARHLRWRKGANISSTYLIFHCLEFDTDLTSPTS